MNITTIIYPWISEGEASWVNYLCRALRWAEGRKIIEHFAKRDHDVPTLRVLKELKPNSSFTDEQIWDAFAGTEKIYIIGRSFSRNFTVTAK